MGGSIRKDFSAKISHLVANSSTGEKYRVRTCLVFSPVILVLDVGFFLRFYVNISFFH